MCSVLRHALLDHAREDDLKDGSHGWESAKAIGQCSQTKTLCHNGNPKVMLPRFYTTKVLTKRETADNVKGGQIVPHGEVGALIILASLRKLLHEAVNTFGNEWLLGFDGSVREGAAEISAHLCMVLGIALAHNRQCLCGEVSPVVK